MTVFHASNVEVKCPMLVESNRLLDFGPGFYTTTNREQAVRFARSVVAKRGGNPVRELVFATPGSFHFLRFLGSEAL